MMSNVDALAQSRLDAAVSELGDCAVDRHRFREKNVLIAVADRAADTSVTDFLFESCLRLLSRFCKNVFVKAADLRSTGVHRLIDQLCIRVIEDSSLSDDQVASYDAVLCIGPVTHIQPDHRTTFVSVNGWIARVSQGPIHELHSSDETNPIAAFGAACLAVADVFKTLLNVKQSRARKSTDLSFSFFDFTAPSQQGPPLAAKHGCDLLLIGAGAIGSAVAYLLQRMPLFGSIEIVDYQRYAVENFVTTIFLDKQHLGKSKARTSAAMANGRLRARGHDQKFKQWARGVTTYAPIVLTALDDIDIRHDVQDALWPEILIDGATGSFISQVTVNHWHHNDPCLRCVFKHPEVDSLQLAFEATGIPVEVLSDPQTILTADIVARANATNQRWLDQRLGRNICSIVSEAVTENISENLQEQSFAPAVPFVAGLSACMMVAALYHYLDGRVSTVNRFQFDTLVGPTQAVALSNNPDPTCFCQTRRSVIESVRLGHLRRLA